MPQNDYRPSSGRPSPQRPASRNYNPNAPRPTRSVSGGTPQNRPSSRQEQLRRHSPSPAQIMMKKRKKAKKRRELLAFTAVLLIFLAVSVGLIVSVIHKAGEDAKQTEPQETQTSANTSETAVQTETEAKTVATEPVAAVTDPPIPETIPKADGRTVICVDPGHGYYDNGASHEYLDPLYEKDVNLDIGLKLRDKLEAAGYEVIMTRVSDENPDGSTGKYLFGPEKRLAFIQDHPEIDYFISIHCNLWTGEGKASGVRLYYYDNNSSETPAFASSVKTAVWNTVATKEPKIYAYNADNAYVVTRHSYCPAILVEIGFISDKTEAENMKNESWRDRMALALAKGISDYVG